MRLEEYKVYTDLSKVCIRLILKEVRGKSLIYVTLFVKRPLCDVCMPSANVTLS